MTQHLTMPACRLLCLLAACVAGPIPCAADVVLEWNAIARDVLRENPALQNPGMASRSLAMMNLAMYDALAMSSSDGVMFYDYGGGHASPGYDVSREAAAIQAAYTVLVNVYDDRYPYLVDDFQASLAQVPDSAAKTAGIALGEMISLTVFNNRKGDGFDNRHRSRRKSVT